MSARRARKACLNAALAKHARIEAAKAAKVKGGTEAPSPGDDVRQEDDDEDAAQSDEKKVAESSKKKPSNRRGFPRPTPRRG